MFYLSALHEHSAAKSNIVILVARIIFAIVPHDGHRGVPSGENCLLLLKVVASNPLRFASPEQVSPWLFANFSIAFHNI